MKTAEIPSQTSQAVKETLRPDHLQGILMERTLSNLLHCLQAMQGMPGFKTLWAVTHAGVGFGGAAVFE